MKVFPFLSPLWILNVKILWSSAESWEPVTQSDSRSFPHPAGKIFQWFVCCPSLCCDWNAAWWLLFSSPSFLLNPPGTFWLTDRPHCLAVKVSGECYCYHRTLLVITRTQSRDMAGYYVSTFQIHLITIWLQTLFGLLELESSKQKIFGQSEIRKYCSQLSRLTRQTDNFRKDSINDIRFSGQTATIIRNENTKSDGKLEKYFFATLLDHLFDRSYFSVVVFQ